MNAGQVLRRSGACLLAAAALFTATPNAQGQVWDATKYFRYDIENVTVAPGAPGSWTVKVIFSVANPVTNSTWNIKTAAPFTSAGASLTLDIGWDPGTDFTNTGSTSALLAPTVTKLLGSGAAIPVQVRNLATTGSSPCTTAADCPGVATLTNRFWVQKSVTPVAFTAPVVFGRVALEGKPVCIGVTDFACPAPGLPPAPLYQNIPVRSAVASFSFAPADPQRAIVADPRRQVVDFAKCQQCHDGKQHGDVVVPRLSLHGNNRNENLSLCVMCHNANQTDVPYRYNTAGTTADPRIGGPEVSIDLKTMVHAIHAGGFRTTPLVIVGFGSSVNDFSDVRFPAELRECTRCHIDANGKGTFELPLKSGVLGTTVQTQSLFQVPLGENRTIDVNPSNDTKVSPTAAVCSSCHDRAEVKSHMVGTGGASFATTQLAIGSTVKERCVTCHGPGKDKDVRRAHEIGGSDD